MTNIPNIPEGSLATRQPRSGAPTVPVNGATQVPESPDDQNIGPELQDVFEVLREGGGLCVLRRFVEDESEVTDALLRDSADEYKNANELCKVNLFIFIIVISNN